MSKKLECTFKRETRNFVIATLKKIYVKCILLFDVVKNCTIFNPDKIQPGKTKYLKQKVIVSKIVNLNFFTFSKAAKAYIQYCNFIDDDMQLIQENVKLFKRGESLIDDFFFQKIKVDIKYPDMSTRLVLIMTLSHG